MSNNSPFYTETFLKLVYPETRLVTAKYVIGWAHDILIDDEMLAHQNGGCTEDCRCEVRASMPSLEDAVTLLEDRGVATFLRGEL